MLLFQGLTYGDLIICTSTEHLCAFILFSGVKVRHLKTGHERVGILEIHPIPVPYDIGLDVTLPSCELKSVNPPISKKSLMSF